MPSFTYLIHISLEKQNSPPSSLKDWRYLTTTKTRYQHKLQVGIKKKKKTKHWSIVLKDKPTECLTNLCLVLVQNRVSEASISGPAQPKVVCLKSPSLPLLALSLWGQFQLEGGKDFFPHYAHYPQLSSLVSNWYLSWVNAKSNEYWQLCCKKVF